MITKLNIVMFYKVSNGFISIVRVINSIVNIVIAVFDFVLMINIVNRKDRF